MKKSVITVLTLGAVVLMTAGFAVGAAVDLPYADGFESPLHTAGNSPDGVGGWTATNSATTAAQVQPTDPIEQNNSCLVATNQLRLDLKSTWNPNSNAWCLIHTKPGLYTDAPAYESVEGVAAAFYVDKDRDLKCYSSNEWQTILTSVPTNEWLAIAVHLDYNASAWDIYGNTSGVFQATMARLNSDPLRFTTNYFSSELTNLTVDTELPGRIDYVAATKGSVGVAAGTPTNLDFYARPPTFELVDVEYYRYDSTENRLCDQLGEDLKGEVGNGNSIWVHETNGWNEYELQVDVWVPQGGALSDLCLLHITDADSIWMDRESATYAAAGFAAYDTLETPANNPIIKGTNWTETLGWNPLAWPSSQTRNQASGWGVFPLSSGDQMYIMQSSGPGHLLNYNSSAGYWRRGRTYYSGTLSEGQEFFYYWNDTGTDEWDVSGLPQ